jgi:hypothetical protein
MSEEQIELLYETYVKPLPARDRLRLLALAARDLALDAETMQPPKEHSILGSSG